VRIRFESEGGFGYFPGLQRPIELDTEQLPAQQATKLEQLVQAANLLDRPDETVEPRPGAADHRTFTITVDDGARSRTLTLAEPLDDQTLQALVDHLTAEQRSRPGSAN
jgi:hypothetical protein